MSENQMPEAERESATKPSVVPTLGYPLGRNEASPEPTGWQVPADSVGKTEKI
ncbi:MAG: hypothetical protein RLZZ164_933 [Actinomycetota bacterium]|jgi:hypothetical protein